MYMQAWGKHKKLHVAEMSKIKSSFRQQLNRCVKKNLIQELYHVNGDDPFIIYEFVDKFTGI